MQREDNIAPDIETNICVNRGAVTRTRPTNWLLARQSLLGASCSSWDKPPRKAKSHAQAANEKALVTIYAAS